MNELNSNLPYGATPIDADEMAQLIPKHIKYLSELNELEQKNISNAILWLSRSRKKDFFSISFIMKLHNKMFEDVWNWSGKFRLSNKNIGCEWNQVPSEIKNLLDNVLFWIENKTYNLDEIGARLHHKLVYIHPFPNGNGRHARLYCDAFMLLQKSTPFSWGNMRVDQQSTRKEYIDALRKADKKDYAELIKFVRS